MELIEILEALKPCFGPAGQEGDVGDRIAALAEPYADEITRDVMGNLMVRRKGTVPRVMFAAHMDSLGFIVTHVTDEGFLRVGKLGGISPQEVLGTPVRFQNGVLGGVHEDQELGDTKREMGHLYVDIGAASKAEALERVQVGDAAIYNTPLGVSGHAVIGPYLDDRMGCAVLLKALEQVKGRENDLWFVFTVQEEVGLRGAQTAAFSVAPDYALAVDVTPDGALPGSKGGCSSRCGGGAAIKVMDSSVICHPQVVRSLRALAQRENIPYQMDVIDAGGTDAGAIHKSRGGVVTGGVSIPCRNVHSPQEVCWLSDGEAAVALVAAFAQEKLEPAPRFEG